MSMTRHIVPSVITSGAMLPRSRTAAAWASSSSLTGGRSPSQTWRASISACRLTCSSGWPSSAWKPWITRRVNSGNSSTSPSPRPVTLMIFDGVQAAAGEHVGAERVDHHWRAGLPRHLRRVGHVVVVRVPDQDRVGPDRPHPGRKPRPRIRGPRS